MAKTTTVVKVKLVQVNFVPTTYEVDDEGKRLTAKRMVIGQLAFGCEFLPDDIQTQLREIIAQAYATQIGAMTVEISPPESRI